MRSVSVLALAAVLAQPGTAQDKGKLPKWKIDPYTKNDPEALKKAGYLGYGPFNFGFHGSGPMTTEQVEKHLSYVQLLWVETPHFRIGIDLPTYTVPLEPEFKNKIRAELERLATKLPGIDPKTRTLPPWLRLHLFAQRCEDIYAEFSTLAGVKDADFPGGAGGPATGAPGVWMGMGPFLGMKEKYLLLLVNKEGTFKDYMKSYLGRDSKFGQRWHFKDIGALIYTVCCDAEEGRLKDDTAMHCDVAFNISQNLLDGFRHYSYDLPVWIREGIGHWFNRRVNPRFNSFDQNEGSTADMKKEWQWEIYCRVKLVQGSAKYAPFSEAFTWRDFGSITFNDHVAIWSRIDYMMSMGPEKWRAFLFEVKGRMDAKGLADQADLVGATRQALQKAYGINALEFDEKWAEWVKATYPAQ